MSIHAGDGRTRVLVPAGQLGAGVSASEIATGLALEPHAIALDAGSTDSGAASLATGKSKYGRGPVRRDLEVLMAARAGAGIPCLSVHAGRPAATWRWTGPSTSSSTLRANRARR